jgi:hypothetical protein
MNVRIANHCSKTSLPTYDGGIARDTTEALELREMSVGA